MPAPMRDFEAWQRSIKNFEWLGEKVPGAMDVDVLIERRGRFLVIEAKPWQRGVSVGFGQHLALSALSKLDEFDVFLVGEVATKETLYVLRYDSGEPVKNRTRPVWFPAGRFTRTTKEGLGIMATEWYQEQSTRQR